MRKHFEPENFVDEIGGLPFVDEGFQPRKLVTAVTCLRRNIDPGLYASLVDYLKPTNAFELYRKRAKSQPEPYPSIPLASSETLLVQSAIQNVNSLLPQWNDHFLVPIEYRKTLTEHLSVTSTLIPQHILLGERAFVDPILLQETLVHEMSHVWCGFIAEIFDFQTKDCPNNYVLPSGTKSKNVRGVLLAALFAAAVITFYAKLYARTTVATHQKRGQYFRSYLLSCLDMVDGSPYATQMGREINGRLRNFVTRNNSYQWTMDNNGNR